MSDLTATSCGCSNPPSNDCGCGGSILWILILCCLCGNGGFGGGFGGMNDIFDMFFGGGFGGGCGCGGFNICGGNNDGCGCGGNILWILILLCCCN